jgi:hypothetical protein
VADFIDPYGDARSLGTRQSTPFGDAVTRIIEPAQTRLTNEVRRLGLIDRVALEYLETVAVEAPVSSNERGD